MKGGPPDALARHLTFVFIDGVGLGGREDNPLATLELPAFERLAGGQRWTSEATSFSHPSHVFLAIDATLGVEGLPQSGTGQTALFTGVNAPLLAGRHYGPYPHTATFEALRSQNVFRQLLDLPASPPVAFVNAYPDRFFQYAEGTNRWTTTTRMCRDASVRLRTEADVRSGDALTAEFTGQAWRDLLGIDVPLLSPHEAGQQLHRLSRQHGFTLFEYYLTDKAGHSRDAARAAEVLRELDGFLAGYLDGFDPSCDLLLITSDHGNLEALTSKSHTRNPVPLVAFGAGAKAFASGTSLLDVTPGIVETVGGERGEGEG